MNIKEKRKIYKEIYVENRKSLFQYAYYMSSSKEDAEDLLHETFIRAWNGLENLKDFTKVKPWLKTILRREFIRIKLKTSETMNVSIQDVEYLIEDNYNLDAKSDLNQALNLINELKKEYRDVLILQSVYGYKINEISSITKLNENTVSTRIFRARNKLKLLNNKEYRKNQFKEKIDYMI